METEQIQNQINTINNKLDILLEEMELQRKHRREIEDLKDDLMRVGKDLYDTAIVEFEEVHDQLQTGDVFYLGKKLLRNIRNITKTFEQMESTKDFIQDFSPISHELFADFMNRLDEFDRKGYFQFIKELTRVSDKVVTQFTVQDVKDLGENIATILNTVKSLTQPDMLQTINNAVSVYKSLDIEVSEKVTLFSLLREFNKPEMKRGMAFAIQFLKNMADVHQISSNKLTKQLNTN